MRYHFTLGNCSLCCCQFTQSWTRYIMELPRLPYCTSSYSCFNSCNICTEWDCTVYSSTQHTMSYSAQYNIRAHPGTAWEGAHGQIIPTWQKCTIHHEQYCRYPYKKATGKLAGTCGYARLRGWYVNDSQHQEFIHNAYSTGVDLAHLHNSPKWTSKRTIN